ncbi:Ribonuclease/ribotoxin [Lentinula edodes]|uniref:Ribonuclease/ribotoxin n=1 Tax=Lentinula edodes TaxID=5353 RepID=UPI001E8CC7BD|nr:Ribonuclease/ribotoxin [Lentinula edodes]KAH7869419.1 Ribonuclease/ribotoxin [Lentinula edodes]KAJ3909469.1 Ribonuclease/ribotoxin [Lentinula edodes]KAJ3918923.1 Ribonuclease/ribotoxin [Lentinula edodes]
MSSTGITIFYEPSGCNCDGTAYTEADINAAGAKALQLASEKKTLGEDKYPHVYNDYERFNFVHAMKPYLEFPIERNAKTYNGGSPGADRLVIGSIAEDFSSAVYCAVITHDGEKKNGFAECADDTLNPRGKGKYEPGAGEVEKHHKKHGHHSHRYGDRKLREYIEI